MQKMRAFDVMLNGERIDTVFFTADSTEDEVKRSLIEWDGYDPEITVEDVEKSFA
jgi:hypothetical protein